MKARVLALVALAASLCLVAAAVALGAFGGPETADPERWTGANDAIQPDRQLVADASGRALWLTSSSTADARGPVALRERCGTPATWPQTHRFGGSSAVPTAAAVTPDGTAMFIYYVDAGGQRTFSSLVRRKQGDNAVWGSPQQIVTADETTLFSALGANGDAVAAWVSGGKAHASVRPAQGTWSAAETLDASAQSARVAMDADGDAVLMTYGGGQMRAYFRPAGGAWGPAEKIEDLGFFVLPESQEIEFDGAGRPVAVYSQQGRLHASVRAGGAWQATPTALDETNRIGVAPLARHPGGLVVAWLRRLSDSNPNLELAVARLNGSTWEAKKVYAGTDQSFATATVSASPSGQIVLAAARQSGAFGAVEEIWGTTLASIAAPWPDALERISPASDAEHRYREPDSAAGGDRLLVGFAVHGGPDAYSQVVATGPAPACAGAATPTPTATPSPTPTPTPTPTADPLPVPSPGPGSPASPPRASRLVTLPSARRCARAKSLVVRLKPPPAGFAVKKVGLRVNGKPAKLRRSGPRVRLRRLPRKRFKLEVVLMLEGGQVVKASRRYRPCR